MLLHLALKLLRTSHDFSQKELAQKLKVSSSYLSEIESGKKTPSLVLLERYGEVFEVPVSSILFLAENMNCQPHNRKALVSGLVLALLDFVAQRSGVVEIRSNSRLIGKPPQSQSSAKDTRKTQPM